MLRLLLPILLALFGLGGGIAAGAMYGGGGTAAESDAPDPTPTPEEDAQARREAAAGSGPGSVSPGSDADLEYVRLNNQFVVPIVRDDTVRALVVLALTVEIEAGNSELVFTREPRLRDSFLRVMFAHANIGGFDGRFTNTAMLEPLREGLREAARNVLGPAARDVLIVDIVRQDA